MLSKIFSVFDNLCINHNVYKVHTIGDCYVVSGFAQLEPGTRRNPIEECENTINIALDMIKSVKNINRDKNTNFNLRIGLHTGEALAGVTGTNIRYDIYGSDVDIANQVEFKSAPGKINISENSKKLLEAHNSDRFDYYFNQMITHQDKCINTYYLRALRHEDFEF